MDERSIFIWKTFKDFVHKMRKLVEETESREGFYFMPNTVYATISVYIHSSMNSSMNSITLNPHDIDLRTGWATYHSSWNAKIHETRSINLKQLLLRDFLDIHIQGEEGKIDIDRLVSKMQLSQQQSTKLSEKEEKEHKKEADYYG